MEHDSAGTQKGDFETVTRATQRDDEPEPGSVLFVSQEFPPDISGHASRIDETTSALAREGWDVTVVAPPACFPHGEFDRSWQLSQRTERDGVTVVRLWAWQPSSPDPGFVSRLAYFVLFALHATLWTLFHRRDYDALVTTTPPISTGLAGFAFGRDAWVVDVRDLWIDASVSLGFIEQGGLLERVSRAFQRRVLRTADRIAVTTKTVGEQLRDQYGDSLGPKLLHVPNGVNVRTFSSRTDGGNVVQTRSCVDDSRPIPDTDESNSESLEKKERPEECSGELIYTGNIGHAQNLDTCVRALQHLPEGVTLRFVGGGDVVPDLKELAAEIGVEHRVTFVGPVSQEKIPELLDEADVGLAPLEDDPELAYAMPTKVYEYLGSELPVVVTGRGEVKRFVRESGGGLHAESEPEAVATAISSLLEDETYRIRTGKAGREYVETHYDRRSIGRDFSNDLAELIDGGE